MYSMKDVCDRTGLSYETLKFYCNQGLVPNVKRDEANRRVFDDRDLGWIESLLCLRKCGMGIPEMKEYLALCLQGKASIPARKEVLAARRELLEKRLAEVQGAIRYIDDKQDYFDRILSGEIPFQSNLLDL